MGKNSSIAHKMDTSGRSRSSPTTITITGEYRLKCKDEYGDPHWEANKTDFPRGINNATISVHALYICHEKNTFKVTYYDDTGAEKSKEYDVKEDNTRAITMHAVKSLHIKCDCSDKEADYCKGSWTVTYSR